MQLRIFFKTYPETSKCPSCGKVGTIRRSRARNFFETALKFSTIISPFKCRDCGWRGLLKKYTVNRYSFVTIVFYAILTISIAYIITAVLKKNFGIE
ncbi:MAG TPA: hypothetical protein VJ455_10845 [Ignavibacteria bacterium]|nr:hypothetical protein [Ignavibacteria bacterium]